MIVENGDSAPVAQCLSCGKPVPDYEPTFCCADRDCGCLGLPTEPCCCSTECENALYEHTNKSLDERRALAGIEKWTPQASAVPQLPCCPFCGALPKMLGEKAAMVSHEVGCYLYASDGDDWDKILAGEFAAWSRRAGKNEQ